MLGASEGANVQKQQRRVETNYDSEMKMHCIETDKAVKIIAKNCDNGGSDDGWWDDKWRQTTPIGKWLCCSSIQIENMKTILKVLKIFSSFASLLLFWCSLYARFTTFHHRIQRHRHPSSPSFLVLGSAVILRQMHAVCYQVLIYLFLSILHVATRIIPISLSLSASLSFHTIHTVHGAHSQSHQDSLTWQKTENRKFVHF